MKTYFKNVKSFEDLKEQFKKLARVNHPDAGGDAETMKEINCEYDALFPIWKNRKETTTGETINETADGTRTQFYTDFGWEGHNHDWNRTLKEIAQIVRSYVKEKYPTYKFSVKTSYASMCQELHVALKESPIEIYKTADELTDDNMTELIRKANRNQYWTLNCWNDEEARTELEKIWTEHGNFYRCFTEVTRAVVEDVDTFVKSYNFEDCDGMTDYFHVDFYYFGCKTNDVKIVPKTARIKNQPEEIAPSTTEDEVRKLTDVIEEYTIKESTHTKTGANIWLVNVVRILSKDEYIAVNKFMKSLGGYYSRFTHSFVFDHDPTEELEKASA